MAGFMNITTVTLENVTRMANVTNYGEYAVFINEQIYGGWLYFFLLLVLMAILYFAYDKSPNLQDQPIKKLLYSSTLVTLVAIPLRLAEVMITGDLVSAITDFQMWIFPITTTLLATILWITQNN